MSAGCGGEVLPALQCADGEAWRSKGSLERMHPMKNSVSGSCVEAPRDATLYKGVCTIASRSNEGTGREHVGQRTSCAEGGTKALEGPRGADTLKRELFERELRRNVLRDSDAWNSLRGGIQKWGGDG